ncbi:MAG: hypothetical protein ABJ308_04270 [Halieaceae bacterium]
MTCLRMIAILPVLLLAACASTDMTGYEKFYKADKDVAGSAVGTQPAAPARIQESLDVNKDSQRLRAKGYAVLGESEFIGPLEGDEGILKQAQKVHATLVLKSVQFYKTQPKFKKVYQSDDGITYIPEVAPREEQAASADGADAAAEAAADEPRYVTEDLYLHKVVFLAGGA